MWENAWFHPKQTIWTQGPKEILHLLHHISVSGMLPLWHSYTFPALYALLISIPTLFRGKIPLARKLHYVWNVVICACVAIICRKDRQNSAFHLFDTRVCLNYAFTKMATKKWHESIFRPYAWHLCMEHRNWMKCKEKVEKCAVTVSYASITHCTKSSHVLRASSCCFLSQLCRR